MKINFIQNCLTYQKKVSDYKILYLSVSPTGYLILN